MKKDKGKKGFWGEFREFALKGSVVDLAVGIIIGGAFQSIVNSLVKDVVMPFVGLLTGGLDFTSRFLILKPAPDGVDAAKLGDIAYVRDTLNLPVFAYGSFLTAVLNFLIMALVIFLIIKVLNKLKEVKIPHLLHDSAEPVEIVVPTVKTCPFCCSEIPAAATRCPHCTSVLEETAKEAQEAEATEL